ncbi:hypothetical protein QN366_01450 [Pseudomonas sp. CCC3.2]|uniref:hypothetical protein n=1 Tax=unclassified Pseudomonas TaxID=196821 RepID=UPI002AB3EE65|nr:MULTISPECIES: hypothetical protein [unclassified Pseudomonas]MDY7560186.1 hypothetical protein [Pseudomonas sp. AB6]MEB0178735.1 hypothetical protein [Pseudomonas sp. CCC3.2]MEB0211373.1 hypothetical protein [Pseudomonas sp. AB6]
MNRARELCNKIEARLRVIRGLADILMENDVFKTGAAGDGPAQLEADHELIVHGAVHLLSDQAQDEMIELMDAMEVPV